MLKEHISYSEVRQWKECPWRHKLIYVDKLQTFEESPHLHYGTIVHDACEHYLKTRELKLEETANKIKLAWEEHGFDSEDYIVMQTMRAELQGWKYKHSKCSDWIEWAETSILALPSFLEETFPGWETVAAEEKLYETIESVEETKFKGYIDCIIRIPQKADGKYKYWILDWKTSSARGWSTDKKRDFLTHAQVVLYKNYWALKNNIKLSDVLCGFVLLKKVKNKDKACQLIRVASGPKTLEKSNKLVRSMIKSQKSSLVLKNRDSCKFCEFYNTENCK